MINYTRKRGDCQVHPLLAQAAIREGYGRFYRAWVALRTTYAGRRRGWVYYKSACGILKRCLSLKSSKAAELILQQGEPRLGGGVTSSVCRTLILARLHLAPDALMLKASQRR